MDTLNNDDFLIDQYLSDELSDKEKQEVEHRLTFDSEFNEKYQLHRWVENRGKDRKGAELKVKLDEFHDELFPTRRKGLFSYIKWAAMIVILAGLGVLLFHDRGDDLSGYATIYNLTLPTSVLDRSENQFDSNNAVVVKLIGLKAFHEARDKLEVELENNPNNHTAAFLLGYVHLQLQQLRKAEKQFKDILKNPVDIYHQDALYYLAITYLQKGKRRKAMDYLEEIINLEGNYYPESHDLYNKISY